MTGPTPGSSDRTENLDDDLRDLPTPMGALLGDEGDNSRRERMTLVSDADRRRPLPQPHQRTALQRAEDLDEDDDELAATPPLEDDPTSQDILPDRISREPR